MINISFGCYFPLNTIIHRLDPRTKIILTIFAIALAFTATNFYSLGVVCAFTIIIIATTCVHLKYYLKTIKTILFFIILTAVLNCIYVKGEPWFNVFGLFDVTYEGAAKAAFLIIRIIMLIMISMVLTFTTTPTELTDAIERLLLPFKKIGLDTHSFAMMMTIALRFIPTLLEEADKIMNAQKSRGSDMGTGGLIKKIKAVIPIIIPLLVSSFRRARELADAMECRCYTGGKGRTRMKTLSMSLRDILAFFVVAIMFGAVIFINIIL